MLSIGVVDVVGLEVVCSSWSRARDRPGGPPPLRDSHKFLFGLPDRKPGDLKNIREGNFQYRSCMRIIKKCLDVGVPGYLENPKSSRFFLTPGVKKLVSSGLGHLVDLDQCQYGAPYRKRTTLLIWGLPPGSACFKMCTGRRGRCSRTNRKHVHLAGQQGGVFKTRAAQAYPQQMAAAIAEVFSSSRNSGQATSNAVQLSSTPGRSRGKGQEAKPCKQEYQAAAVQ